VSIDFHPRRSRTCLWVTWWQTTPGRHLGGPAAATKKGREVRNHPVLTTIIAAVAIVGLSKPSIAQEPPGALCNSSPYLFPGQQRESVVNPAALRDGYYKTRVTAGRSYSVMAWGPAPAGGVVDLTLALFSDSACTTPAESSTTLSYEPSTVVPGHSGAQASIVPTFTGPLYIRVTNNNVFRDETVNILLMETTQFSPWWFTGGTNQAFIEVRNNMFVPSVLIQVTLFRSDGSICGSSDNFIPGNGNIAIAVKTIGACATAVSGSAQIAFLGTPGGIAANITTIDVVNGTSFDSPFTPRMTWSTFSR
jgi:hypothetical protein